MSVAELKLEVINKISEVDDERLLKEMLSLLTKTNNQENYSYDLSNSYEAIKEQYGDVLQKLAQ